MYSTLGCKNFEVAESTEHAASRRVVSITEALDGLEVSNFHRLHAAKMVFAWLTFASSQEATPYTFPGLRRHFDANDSQLGTFASAFLLGCLLGAMLASMIVDKVGRLPIMAVSAPMCSCLHAFMVVAPSFHVLVVARVVEAAAWGLLLTAIATWYAEFLPTKGRGPLMAVFSLGWPIGRFLIILAAGVTNDAWQPVLLIGAANFAVLSGLIFIASESPRYLVSRGETTKAHLVLHYMYSKSGKEWDASVCIEVESTSRDQGGQTALLRLQELVRHHGVLVTFSFVVFAGLSTTTVLLDTWGPDVYHKLISPQSKTLPHFVLSMFNVGDAAGIMLSIIIADRIGRRGSFILGFFVQPCLLACMLAICLKAPAVVNSAAVFFGTLSSGCRCFGWEAAHMWTLEAFPTHLRAMAFGCATSFMRLCGMTAVQISSELVGGMAPKTALLSVICFMVISGVVVLTIFPMETAGAPMDEDVGSAIKSSHSVKD